MTPEQLQQRVEAKKKSRQAYIDRNPKWAWARCARKDAKRRAVQKGIPFDLTIAQILSVMKDKCPIFGTEFQFQGNGRIKPESPALDRIIPELGYVENNIQIISVKANSIKSAYGSKELYKVADWLYELEKVIRG